VVEGGGEETESPGHADLEINLNRVEESICNY